MRIVRIYNRLMYLQLSQLSVRYPGLAQRAVSEVTFGLKAGDIGVLIGPSGCGKTTLLRAVAGLEPVSSGSVQLAGEEVSRVGFSKAPEQRRIGMVFQDYALFPHMDIGRNVAFGIMHWRDAERRERVREVLALSGWHWRGRWHPSRNCCCLMSRFLILM
jgi:iron(III) transport system ATP-binding protein